MEPDEKLGNHKLLEFMHLVYDRPVPDRQTSFAIYRVTLLACLIIYTETHKIAKI